MDFTNDDANFVYPVKGYNDEEKSDAKNLQDDNDEGDANELFSSDNNTNINKSEVPKADKPSDSIKDSRDILKKQGIDYLFTEAYRPPSFNYIIFWRHLDLQLLENMIKLRNVKESNINIIINELSKLFINKNTKFLSLFIPYSFKYQLHSISWAEQCFSSLKSLHYFDNDDISGSLTLIENQNNLNEIQIDCCAFAQSNIIEKSLIKKADTIQHLQTNWDPEDEFLSYFVNLSSLKIGDPYWYGYPNNKTNWCHLEKVSLPGLKVLIANIDSHQNLDRMIKIINGHHLHEITLCHNGLVSDANYHRRLIRAIYQNCPNLRYLSMPMMELNFPEFERLLINCQKLNGLIFKNEIFFKYKSLFEILIKSSPISLYKFKIYFNRKFGPKFKLLKSFFNNWKDRHPMMLQINRVNFDDNREVEKLEELVKKYEV
ncbi:16984_t:CDS:2 [Rhizophagus irregularis]|nr:16984_t:CDS:2 [Rhizophagus irregularis]